ncbi:MAG: glycosyltransferase family 4 protein [Gammaproteobacteria bacterium]|nr:glycosyltransferase family 4 protein [Gammaproteobacteria bacterium]
MPEAVIDEQTGLLVAPDDIEATAQAIIRLATDPELRKRLGQRGRVHVRTHYDWKHNVETMLEIYDAMVNGWPVRGE